MSQSMQASRTYPVAAERAYATVLPHPLPEIFSRRFAALPAIKSVDGPPTWDSVGQTRTITLADGGTMRERLTSVTPGTEFSYEIGQITGVMKLLIAKVEGQWRFDAAGEGSRITWEWTVHPANAAGRLALPVFARMWQGYARQALEEIERLLVA